jgi:hypothetical protein
MGPSSRAAESSLRCCHCIVPWRLRAPEARRKAEIARESVNSISGTFAHEVLNIRYAIGDLHQEDRKTRRASGFEI